MIVLNPQLLAAFRRRKRCELCGARLKHPAHPHHYKAKGMGGGSRLDIPENLIALGGPWDCDCHGKAHSLKAERAEVLAAIARRLGKTPEEVREVIFETWGRAK